MMGWRVVLIKNRAKLELKSHYLVVRQEQTKRIHLSEIAVLIVESTAVSLTAGLLCELTKRKVKVVFCDEKRSPSSELMPCYGSHDTSGKVRAQWEWTKQAKEAVWTAVVKEKIRNQSRVLKKNGMAEWVKVNQYVSEVQSGDVTNREGHAAKVYFNALFGMDFTRGAEGVQNAALNYGYALLLSAFNREIVALGYLTQIGISHSNVFNAFNLSSDFMEPFRVLIDEEVYQMTDDVFEKEMKMRLINILNKTVCIQGKNMQTQNAIRVYVKSLTEAIENNDTSMIRFLEYEL